MTSGISPIATSRHSVACASWKAVIEAAASKANGQDLVGPEQDRAAGNLAEADEGQVAHQRAAQRAVKDVEADGKEGQEERRQPAVEQERGLHEAPDARLAAVEIPQPLEARQVLLAPLDQRRHLR